MPFAQTAGLVCGAVFLLLAVYLVASFFGSRRTVPDRYLPRMHDPDPAVRLRALQMLRAVFRVSDSGRQERMVQAFREACRDPNQKVSREARDTLMYFGQVLGRPDLALPERAAQPQPTPPEPAPVLAEGTAPPSPPDGPPAPSPATPLVPEEPRTLTLPVPTDPASLRVRVFISSTQQAPGLCRLDWQ